MRPTLLLPLILLLTACAAQAPTPPSLRPSLPGGTRIEMPEVLGSPVAILAPELPAGAIADGEVARFDIAFTIDLRGAVTESRVESTNRPDLAAAMLAQHRQWIYAVATREQPCRMQRFRGVQPIEVQRRDGKLTASSAPARVVEVLARQSAERFDNRASIRPVNLQHVMGSIAYPGQAIRDRIEARFAVIALFGTDGAVKDTYPVNAAYDRYGFAQNAMIAVRRLKLEPPPAREFTACIPIDFLLR
jgi:outer membrane biosynthesis protein TonB